MSDERQPRWLVMKESGQGYYQSWTMIQHGHCETREKAEALEQEWHRKYPRKKTLIIQTIGAPYSTVAKVTP